jgi:hypothetical protein
MIYLETQCRAIMSKRIKLALMKWYGLGQKSRPLKFRHIATKQKYRDKIVFFF